MSHTDNTTTVPDFPLFDVDDAEVALGASAGRFYGSRGWDEGKSDASPINRLLRDEAEIVSTLFFRGGSLRDLGREYKPGIDHRKAQRALQALLGSFGVSHQQKEATCALAIHHWTQPIAKSEEA